MKKLICLIFCVFALNPANGQNYSVDCDGLSGQISIGAGAALIANSQSITYSCWLSPANASGSALKAQGILGVRNDLDADFYLIKSSAGRIEGVFTNSSRQSFVVKDATPLSNQWNHLALTYDGNELALYINGQLSNKTKASGIILDSLSTLRIGTLYGRSSMDCFKGRIDEVRIWQRCQTQLEIQQLMNQELEKPHTYGGLVAYYKLNEPIGAFLAKDEVYNLSGLVNLGATFSRPGAPIFQGTVANYNEVLCEGDSAFLSGKWTKTAGTFRDTTVRIGRTDSLTITELSLIPKLLIPGVVQMGPDSLVCNILAKKYAWFRQETQLSYTSRSIPLNHTGTYRVVAFNEHCPSDTSWDFHFIATNTERNWVNSFRVRHSPEAGMLSIIGGERGEHQISLIDLNGRTLREEKKQGRQFNMDVSTISSGIYFVKIENKDKRFIKKLVLMK